MVKLTHLAAIREFTRRRVSYYEFTPEINVWVFVWLPKGGKLGYTSMFIGRMNNDSCYVSWRANTGGVVLLHKYPAAVADGYDTDYSLEHREPDFIYGLKSLNTPAMKHAWRDICTKKERPSFNLISKNGSTIVKQILKAGLVNSHLRSKVSEVLGSNFYMTTPMVIISACNIMRDNMMGTQIIMSEQ